MTHHESTIWILNLKNDHEYESNICKIHFKIWKCKGTILFYKETYLKNKERGCCSFLEKFQEFWYVHNHSVVGHRQICMHNLSCCWIEFCTRHDEILNKLYCNHEETGVQGETYHYLVTSTKLMYHYLMTRTKYTIIWWPEQNITIWWQWLTEPSIQTHPSACQLVCWLLFWMNMNDCT